MGPPDRSAPAPVFLVGASRSGTTLLRLMLNEHPDLAIPSESHFIGTLFDRFGPDATLSGEALDRALEVVVGFAQWREDFTQTEAELRAAVGSGPLTMAALIDRIFRLEVGPGPARWGDKSPPYLRWVEGLLTCFPAGQAIAIVRDPRDVYLSLERLGWFGSSTWDIGRYLAASGRYVEQWTQRFSADRFTVVRYEDLVLHTQTTLRAVCDYLGLPFAAGMEGFFRNAERNVPQRELDVQHTKLVRPPSSDDVGRWHHEGSRWRHAEIEALTAHVIDAYGYERRVSAPARRVLAMEARARHHLRAPGAVTARTAEQAVRRVRKLARVGPSARD
jgi:hypothetical protein